MISSLRFKSRHAVAYGLAIHRPDEPALFMSQTHPGPSVGVQVQIILSFIGKEEQSQVGIHFQLTDFFTTLLIAGPISINALSLGGNECTIQPHIFFYVS